ncbi:hypothetical protein HPB51_029781 [Rhipicephalus microplus]|uniref:Uncharacterized protein n=1 Tax=Rhipicephalus microplus TaxID=6941 RepID=A0A9J6CSZ0_RHIMP|nr:hypothetical protein HPB51_029781 [Rhipicephalus microplus]
MKPHTLFVSTLGNDGPTAKQSTKTLVSPPSTPKPHPVPATRTKKNDPAPELHLRSRQQRSRSQSASGSGRKSTNNTKVSFAETLKGTSRKGRNANNTIRLPPLLLLPDNPKIAQRKRENANLRDLLTELTQEVKALKQTQTPTPTPTAQDTPAHSKEASLAPKRRALQDGSTGQVNPEVKDMLIALQTTMSTF